MARYILKQRDEDGTSYAISNRTGSNLFGWTEVLGEATVYTERAFAEAAQLNASRARREYRLEGNSTIVEV